MSKSKPAHQSLESIPGIGPSMAATLKGLGIQKVTDLKRRNPEILFDRLCKLQGGYVDRCVLYAFRCAVYFATEKTHDPELLKWWNWKD